MVLTGKITLNLLKKFIVLELPVISGLRFLITTEVILIA